MNLETAVLFQNMSGVRMVIMVGLYIIGRERAKEEMKRAKIKSINNRAGEYPPGQKEEVKEFSKEQVDLVNKLVKLNISKVTAQNLQTYSKIISGNPTGKPVAPFKIF